MIALTLRKNLLALLGGSLACLAALAGLEFLLRARAERTRRSVVELASAPYIAEDQALGFRFAPNATVRVLKSVDSKLVYATEYRSDACGRRITPSRPGSAPVRFALFFGDSMTFGEGLQPDETLPCRFGRLSPSTVPYNYAFQGYGPQQMYAKIIDPVFEREVAEAAGIAVYGYFDYHINRVVGSTEVLRWNAGRHPYFLLRDGALVRDGTFLTGRPRLTAWYSWLNRFRIFRALGIELPVVTAGHRELLCEIIHQSKLAFERKFPGSHFVVSMNPLSSRVDDIQRTCFEPRGIAFVDLRGLFGEYGDPRRTDNPYRIPEDGHYSKEGAALLARALHETLAARGILEE